MALYAPILAIFDDIKRRQAEVPELQILKDSILPPGWTTSDGVFLYKDKIYIPNQSKLKKSILQEFLSFPLGGHGAVQKTFMRISANFFGIIWVKM